MGPNSEQQIYEDYYNQQYREFKGNDSATHLTLKSKGWGPISVGFSNDAYEKTSLLDNKIQIIKKNGTTDAILWNTSAEKIKKAVRWGIIKTESISAQVISTLGKYRIIAHERIAKGMISNTQALKLQLLDIYQERIEVLQELESLVNRNCTKDEYKQALSIYQDKLNDIEQRIFDRLEPFHLDKLDYNELTDNIQSDIASEKARAQEYSEHLDNQTSTKKANRARGNDSILEFVKQQMHHNLYSLQGLNQDIVYSIGALTRGDLNDCIEDARQLIDDHQADMRNEVTAKHHGDFSVHKNDPICYDFSLDHLSSDQERQALLAISFIEGWDKVDYCSNWNKPTVTNTQNDQSEELTKISATKWHTHRNFGNSLWEYTKNWFISILFPTQPWDEGVSDTMHLFADDLKKYVRPQEPLWLKGWHFVEGLFISIKDILFGIYHFSSDFVLQMPKTLFNDLRSTMELPELQKTLNQANSCIDQIERIENDLLEKMLKEITLTQTEKHQDFIPKEESRNLLVANRLTPEQSASSRTFAEVDYHLSPGEQQDPLTALTHAFGSFTTHFTHNLFAKDPVGALLFSTAVATGGMCIFLPTLSKSLFLDTYLKGFTSFAKLVGSSPLSESFCAGLMQGQAAHLLWNGLLEGPSSIAISMATKILENPIQHGLGFAAAYGLGYILANVPVPGLHELIEDELGSSEILNYPVIGVKFGITAVMIILSEAQESYTTLEIPYNGDKSKFNYEKLTLEESNQIIKIKQQIEMVTWLNAHAKQLPKLDQTLQFDIVRHIERLFTKEQATSLKKMIYPQEGKSIAYQFFAIPLNYIPAILRLVLSLIHSAVAWLDEAPHPAEPIQRASTALLDKISVDLNRLNIIAANLLYYTTNLVVSPIKALVSTCSLFIGRIAAFFGYHPGHTTHQAFASIHNIYRDIGASLSPDRAMKSAVSAHPAHTVNQVVASYERLFERYKGDGKKESIIISDDEQNQVDLNFGQDVQRL